MRLPVFSILLSLFTAFISNAQVKLNVNWDKTVMVSKSTPTLQVVVNPPLRKGSSIHDPSLQALKNLGADYVRYVPWLPYPRLAVAELDPPKDGKTSWDFSLIDPMTIDFLEATTGHPVILNFSTIPAWMYKTPVQVSYPEDPNEAVWNYTQGNELVDTTAKQIADYYARLFAWYTAGSFTDEAGVLHLSDYHYKIPYWEVLNEPDLEHKPTPHQYAIQYDAIVGAISKVAPGTKFVGMALAFENDPEWFEYFLNHKNHKPNIPIDMISYHFYATNSAGQTINDMQYTYFERADNFVNRVRYIESIRKRLSPATKTTINEVGSILKNEDSIPPIYWNLSGSLYAYLFLELTKQGIDLIGESQLVGFPSQFPSVSMMNWTNGNPNARYWILKLIKDNIPAGSGLMDTHLEGEFYDDVSALGFKTPGGNKILLINKRNKPITLTIPAVQQIKFSVVDESTKDSEAVRVNLNGNTMELKPFAVAIIDQ